MRCVCLELIVFLTILVQQMRAGVLVDFEGFFDQTVLTTQYTDLVFSNTSVVIAGLTLNDGEFPQHGGNSAAEDCAAFDAGGSCIAGGPVSIDFAVPVTSFSGYFTYAQMLTLTGFDTFGHVLPAVTSSFSQNFVSSGNPPNELLSLGFAGGLSMLTIAGDPNGGSFIMDDLNIDFASTSPIGLPEPSSGDLVAVTVMIFLGVFTCLRLSRRKQPPLA